MLTPNGPRLLVRNVLCSMTAGGLHIPDKVQDRRKVVRAEVIAVGDDASASRFPVGSLVHFMTGSGVEVEYDGEAFLVVKTEEILASEPARPTGVFDGERQLEIVELPQIGPEAFE